LGRFLGIICVLLFLTHWSLCHIFNTLIWPHLSRFVLSTFFNHHSTILLIQQRGRRHLMWFQSHKIWSCRHFGVSNMTLSEGCTSGLLLHCPLVLAETHLACSRVSELCDVGRFILVLTWGGKISASVSWKLSRFTTSLPDPYDSSLNCKNVWSILLTSHVFLHLEATFFTRICQASGWTSKWKRCSLPSTDRAVAQLLWGEAPGSSDWIQICRLLLKQFDLDSFLMSAQPTLFLFTLVLTGSSLSQISQIFNKLSRIWRRQGLLAIEALLFIGLRLLDLFMSTLQLHHLQDIDQLITLGPLQSNKSKGKF